MNSLLKVLQCVAWQDRHAFLPENGPAVHAFIRHQVNHHPGGLDLALLEGLKGALDRVCTRKSTGQGRMEVDHPAGKPFEKGRAENAHPARQQHPIRTRLCHSTKRLLWRPFLLRAQDACAHCRSRECQVVFALFELLRQKELSSIPESASQNTLSGHPAKPS